jgi:hypothetical protein
VAAYSDSRRRPIGNGLTADALEPERQKGGPSAGAPPFPIAARAGGVVCDSKTVRRRRSRALALTASSSLLMRGLGGHLGVTRPRQGALCGLGLARHLRGWPRPRRRGLAPHPCHGWYDLGPPPRQGRRDPDTWCGQCGLGGLPLGGDG